MKNYIKTDPETVEWVKSIGLAVVIAVFINTFVFRNTQVRGISMEPTLIENDRMIAIKASLYIKNPSRGDVIALKIPNPENRTYIKRVIALEGDKIEILAGNVYLNDELLIEDYIEEGAYTYTNDENSWIIPEGELFVLGDNRNPEASYDSRYFGPIPFKAVKGVANFRYFPFGEKFGNVNKTP